MRKIVDQLATVEATEGEPIMVGGRTLTLQAQVLRVRWPGGGLVWNRPTGVLVEGADGEEFLAITDATRWVVLGLWAVTAFSLALALVGGLRRPYVDKE